MIKATFLCNYTSDFLVSKIKAKINQINFENKFYIPGFDQYVQEILDTKSGLYKFQPDIIFISIDLSTYCGEILNQLFEKTNAEIYSEIELQVQTIFNLISVLNGNLPNTVIFVENFYLDAFHYRGTLEYNSDYGTEIIPLKLNNKLSEFALNFDNLRIIDINSIISKCGRDYIFDERFHYIAKNKFSSEGLDKISSLYLSHIKAYKGIRKKCIVLDLDNTLWGGVIGQDGIENIVLSNDGLGKSFYDFQIELLKLYNQGIILAICSKNSEEVAMEAINNHPYMILKPEHFAATKINWDNKAQNIKQIAEELNIGVDSLVFLDDSHFERGLVKQELPEVTVPNLPEDPVYYPKFLKELDYFNFHKLTEDDFKRNASYQANKDRKKLESAFTDITSFLESLEMKVKVKKIDDFSFPRAVQLIQKTNQFNVTTRRHSEAEMKVLYNDDTCSILEMSVEDKFGDYGLVGIAITKENQENSEMYIESFIMSCRVIGRNVETAFLSFIYDLAKEKKIITIKGEIIPTPKNAPCRDLYHRHNFKERQDGFWIFDITKADIVCPDYIRINQDQK